MEPGDIRVCLVSSHGGHLRQMLDATADVIGRHHIATCRTPHTEAALRGQPHTFLVDPHLSLLKYAVNALQSLVMVLRLRPHVVISTGAGIAISTMLFAKYLCRAKIVFIESAANVDHLSRTGSFSRRISDLFIVQWQSQKDNAPEATLVGLL